MNELPGCKRCERPMRQRGRYADWSCECCDESARCPHVSLVKRWLRRMAGRRV